MDSPAIPMNAISKVPQDFLQCPVCLSQYDIVRPCKTPLMLECHHSACRTCISSLINGASRRAYSNAETLMNPRILICPICRSRTRIPINGIIGLQENFYIVSILMNLQNQNSTTVAISENSRDSSDESVLKMWCEMCRKVATSECESHTLKKVSEALLEMEETLNQTLERANDNLAAQEEVFLEGMSSTDLMVKMDRLKTCLNLLTSMINNKIVFLQSTKDWKQALQLTLESLRKELQEIETCKNSTNVSLGSPSSPDSQFASRRYEKMLENLQKMSELLRKTDCINLTTNMLIPRPEELRQSRSESFTGVITDLTHALDM